MIGDSFAPFRLLGRGVAGKSGTANVGSGMDMGSAAADDVVASEARLFLFFVSFTAFEAVFAGSFLYEAVSGIADVVVVEIRAERRRDMVPVNGRYFNANSRKNVGRGLNDENTTK